jgi:hypothetical protein
MNSQGRADVDHEGRLIRNGGNTGKAGAGTAVGGLIDGIAGGWQGAAIGPGTGAAASIAVIDIAADSPEIRFNPGAVVVVTARSRNGSDLTGFAGGSAPVPNTPVNAPAPAVPAVAPPNTNPPPAQPTPPTQPAATAQPDFTAMKDDFYPRRETHPL